MWPQTNKHRPFNFRSVFFLSFGSAGNPRNSGWCCHWYMTTLTPSHVVGGGTTVSPLYPPCVPLSFLLSFCVTCKYNFPQTNTGHSMLVSLWTSLTHLPFFAKVLLSLQYTSPIVLHNGIFGALFLERWLLFFMKSWDSHSPSALCNHSSFLKVGKYGFFSSCSVFFPFWHLAHWSVVAIPTGVLGESPWAEFTTDCCYSNTLLKSPSLLQCSHLQGTPYLIEPDFT